MYARVGVKTNDEWATIQRRSFLLLLLFFFFFFNIQIDSIIINKQNKKQINNHTKHNTHTHTYMHTFIRSCAYSPFCYLKPCKLVNIIQPCTLHLLPGYQLFWFLTSQLIQFHFFLILFKHTETWDRTGEAPFYLWGWSTGFHLHMAFEDDYELTSYLIFFSLN